jgi:Ni/Co efflux regulator RcnB
MTMRKFVLLAAMAAIAMPGAATAQHHHDRDRDRHGSSYDRYDRHDHYDRHDRYDRRGDRDRHGDRHHRHASYAAPYHNWRYRPVSVGHRLDRVYYSPRYYISDYGYYHLRTPRPWERWIRYGDDLLLVNLRTGRVLDVIHYNYW